MFFSGIYKRKYGARPSSNIQSNLEQPFQHRGMVRDLLSADLLTDFQNVLLLRKKRRKGKVRQLPKILTLVEEITKDRRIRGESIYNAFIRYIRKEKQILVAKVLENGGGNFRFLCENTFKLI